MQYSLLKISKKLGKSGMFISNFPMYYRCFRTVLPDFTCTISDFISERKAEVRANIRFLYSINIRFISILFWGPLEI